MAKRKKKAVKKTIRKFPDCSVQECVMHEKGYCIALTNNNFGSKMCPFFKTKEQAAKEEYENQLSDIRQENQEE